MNCIIRRKKTIDSKATSKQSISECGLLRQELTKLSTETERDSSRKLFFLVSAVHFSFFEDAAMVAERHGKCCL